MKQLDEILSRHYKTVFWFLSGFFLVLYLMLVGGDYVWVDESYSIAMVKHSFSEIWEITALDNHPPLYYWYLKIATAPFGYGLTAAKIASILPYMFIIVFGGKQIHKYFNARTAVLFMVMFFCFPFILPYSIEIRNYALASAFVFACAVFAYRFWLEQGKMTDMAGLIISGVLAAYTHYFAFVSVCIIYGLLLMAVLAGRKQLWKKWLLSVVISIVLYVPWFSCFVSQLVYKASHEYWIKEITLGTLYGYFVYLFGLGGDAPYALLFAVVFAAAYLACFLWILASREKKDTLLCVCCILVPVGTLAVGVLASILVRPVFILRYLVPAIPLLVTFMAIVLGKLNNTILFSCILSIVLVGGVSKYGLTIYSEYTNHNYLPIEEYGDVDAYIVVGDSHVAGTLGYYVTEKTIYADVDLHAANPYPNRVPTDTLNYDDVDNAIMLLGVGKTPPVECHERYNIQYLGQWTCERGTDAFLLTKKMG